jgi:hypothetical protein
MAAAAQLKANQQSLTNNKHLPNDSSSLSYSANNLHQHSNSTASAAGKVSSKQKSKSILN